MPFGPYKDFNDCVSKNQDKASPEGYCSNIMRQIEGNKPEDRPEKLTSKEKRPSIRYGSKT